MVEIVEIAIDIPLQLFIFGIYDLKQVFEYIQCFGAFLIDTVSDFLNLLYYRFNDLGELN